MTPRCYAENTREACPLSGSVLVVFGRRREGSLSGGHAWRRSLLGKAVKLGQARGSFLHLAQMGPCSAMHIPTPLPTSQAPEGGYVFCQVYQGILMLAGI